jgi:Lar family restriction alleviation protein
MSQKERDVLKPCPFCGSKPYETRTVNGTEMYLIGCSSCGIEMKAAWYRGEPKSTKDIAALWNRRYPDETPAPTGQKVDADTGEAMAAIKQLQAEYGKPVPPEAPRRWSSKCDGCGATFRWKWDGAPWHWNGGKQCGPVRVVEDTGSGGETPA